jgi:hypothetical protein
MRTGFVFGVLFAATVGGLRAQSTEDFGPLNPGQTVRVRTTGGALFESRLGGTAGAPATDLFAQADSPFQVERVDSLWVRGRATTTGAIVGAAVVTPLSFLMWWYVCDAVADGTGCDEWGVVLGLSFASGAGGALVGAGVGVLIPKWRLRYARGREVTVSPLVAPGRVGLAVRF